MLVILWRRRYKITSITSALLNFGGNIQIIGTKMDDSLLRLGLRDPFSGGALGILEISYMAVVTYGNYERYFISEDGKQYGHIIAPSFVAIPFFKRLMA